MGSTRSAIEIDALDQKPFGDWSVRDALIDAFRRDWNIRRDVLSAGPGDMVRVSTTLSMDVSADVAREVLMMLQREEVIRP